MPTAFIQKIHADTKIPVAELEAEWDRAKGLAKKSKTAPRKTKDSSGFYAYVTRIFKNLIHYRKTASKIKASVSTEDSPMKTVISLAADKAGVPAKSAKWFMENASKIIAGQKKSTRLYISNVQYDDFLLLSRATPNVRAFAFMVSNPDGYKWTEAQAKKVFEDLKTAFPEHNLLFKWVKPASTKQITENLKKSIGVK